MDVDFTGEDLFYPMSICRDFRMILLINRDDGRIEVDKWDWGIHGTDCFGKKNIDRKRENH